MSTTAASDHLETGASDLTITGETVARYVKYYLQFKKSTIRNPISVDRIACRVFYNQHKKVFDSAAKILSKYNISVDKFSKFFVMDFKKTEYDINEFLVNQTTFSEYAQYLAKNKKRNDIYKWVSDSIYAIADECRKNKIFTTKDFLRKAISEKKLATYYVSGVISKYYLAAIPNFNKIIPKLDYFSRLELDDLNRLFEIYKTEVNDAFLYMKNIKINPIRLTDIMISKL